MEKRKIIFGTYDTAANGWTLAKWALSAPEQKTNYVEKSGGDGAWDMSTVLTDGLPRYRNRSLTVTLECSEGDRLSREALIRAMVNGLDGMKLNIELPDDDRHYLVGRLHVARQYNDLAHAAVAVSAVCEPWKYNNTETVYRLTATSAAKTARLVNGGRRAVVPSIVVTGSSASVRLNRGTASVSLGPGTHIWPELQLLPGTTEITYSGTGTVAMTYREAVLE